MCIFIPVGLFSQGGELVRLVLVDQWVDDHVQRPLHDLFQPVQGQADAVVGDPALREIIRPDAFRAVPGTDQVAPVFGNFRSLFRFLGGKQFRLQQGHGPGAVLMLGAFVLAFHHDAAGQVGNADG